MHFPVAQTLTVIGQVAAVALAVINRAILRKKQGKPPFEDLKWLWIAVVISCTVLFPKCALIIAICFFVKRTMTPKKVYMDAVIDRQIAIEKKRALREENTFRVDPCLLAASLDKLTRDEGDVETHIRYILADSDRYKGPTSWVNLAHLLDRADKSEGQTIRRGHTREFGSMDYHSPNRDAGAQNVTEPYKTPVGLYKVWKQGDQLNKIVFRHFWANEEKTFGGRKPVEERDPYHCILFDPETLEPIAFGHSEARPSFSIGRIVFYKQLIRPVWGHWPPKVSALVGLERETTY